MAISSATLTSILRVKKEFNTVTGDITLTDLTDWAGYGIIAPDTAAVLLKLVSPSGATVYINTGFDTDDFSSPDFDLVTDTLAETMPTDVNGDYITGNYTLYIKAQVVDNGDTVDSSLVTSVAEVCGCTATISIDLTADYATAVLTSVDTTNYGAYYSLTRSHTIYPPPISGLANQTTTATTNVYSNIVTTTWSSKVTSTVVYLKANDTYTTCEFEGSKELVVTADTLCATLCLLKKFRTDFYSKFGKRNVAEMERAYNLAVDEFALAMQAARCGQDITPYINKIYEITGIDPDCDCGCDANDFPTPVVPTSIVNGSDGDDGVTPQFQNTGTWIQVSYDEGSTWNNLFSLASVTGAAGASGSNGIDGADGVALLENLISDSATVGTAWETLKTYTILADQLDANKDKVNIRARFRSVGSRDGQECRIQFDGSTVASSAFINNITYLEFDVDVNRHSATQAKIEYSITGGIGTPGHLVQGKVISEITTAGGLDWTTTNVVNADGNSVVIGDIICELLQVTYYKKS